VEARQRDEAGGAEVVFRRDVEVPRGERLEERIAARGAEWIVRSPHPARRRRAEHQRRVEIGEGRQGARLGNRGAQLELVGRPIADAGIRQPRGVGAALVDLRNPGRIGAGHARFDPRHAQAERALEVFRAEVDLAVAGEVLLLGGVEQRPRHRARTRETGDPAQFGKVRADALVGGRRPFEGPADIDAGEHVELDGQIGSVDSGRRTAEAVGILPHGVAIGVAHARLDAPQEGAVHFIFEIGPQLPVVARGKLVLLEQPVEELLRRVGEVDVGDLERRLVGVEIDDRGAGPAAVDRLGRSGEGAVGARDVDVDVEPVEGHPRAAGELVGVGLVVGRALEREQRARRCVDRAAAHDVGAVAEYEARDLGAVEQLGGEQAVLDLVAEALP
jgi:hypothetical protein